MLESWVWLVFCFQRQAFGDAYCVISKRHIRRVQDYRDSVVILLHTQVGYHHRCACVNRQP